MASRTDVKKQKQLEEARKAGTAAPALDKHGNEINPHIPQYIVNAPWYLNASGPGLDHQRLPGREEATDINSWYQRGAKKATAVTKFRKGACENCGAMTHKTKECCERPRKVGAKWNGKDIMADEVVQDLSLDYEAKHDRWNGYDPSNHQVIMDQYEKAEEERRRIRKEEELNKFMTEPDATHKRFSTNENNKGPGVPTESLAVESDSDSDSDDSDVEKKEYLETDGATAVGTKKDPKTRTTIRNLRIREDTAKYLRDLGPEAPYYDPKSRSLRDTDLPNANKDDGAGENFIRADVKKFTDMQKYAWDSLEKGKGVNPVASPSMTELMYREDKEKKQETYQKQREELLSRYGGREHLNIPDATLSTSQSESFVVYAPDGSVMRGKEKLIPKSKYEEDVYINNHTSVWGSFWEAGQWGYACCHSLIKNSYCTGKSGIEARERMEKELQSRTENKSLADQKRAEEEAETRDETPKINQKNKVLAEKERIKLLEKGLRENPNANETEEEKDERKRGYNSLSADSFKVSDADMEAYRLKKKRFDDPMKDFVDK